MKAKPLQNTVHGWRSECSDMIEKEDVASAVEYLKRIVRDSNLISVRAASTYLVRFINKAFPDVVENE